MRSNFGLQSLPWITCNWRISNSPDGKWRVESEEKNERFRQAKMFPDFAFQQLHQWNRNGAVELLSNVSALCYQTHPLRAWKWKQNGFVDPSTLHLPFSCWYNSLCVPIDLVQNQTRKWKGRKRGRHGFSASAARCLVAWQACIFSCLPKIRKRLCSALLSTLWALEAIQCGKASWSDKTGTEDVSARGNEVIVLSFWLSVHHCWVSEQCFCCPVFLYTFRVDHLRVSGLKSKLRTELTSQSKKWINFTTLSSLQRGLRWQDRLLT